MAAIEWEPCITFGLSLTVSKLLAFVCGPEKNDVMPVSPLGGVIGQSSVQIRKGSPPPTSYLRLIITFGPSLAVFELLKFICGPEMTSYRFLR